MATRQQANRSRTAYQYDSAARKLDVREAVRKQPKPKLSNANRKNREKALHMNFGYVFFLTLALLATCYVLVGYITLQADITNSVKHIATLESRLNDLKLANDEEYSRITSGTDLEEIKRIAIGELGMTYAREGQIITFSTNGNDYVRQLADIPEQ
ncbi:MAG: cell division protein FtsL [Lachnospiraceae bacterium]|nr:cell division protein FtsL [Lachnospiraceae bacterium]